jgi:sRNA-binding protein
MRLYKVQASYDPPVQGRMHKPGHYQVLSAAYTRSTGYLMACAQKDAMRYDLDGRAVEPLSEEHRTEALKAVQRRR